MDRREILTQVAEGQLTPADAAERLEALEEVTEVPTPAEAGEIRRVRVIGDFRSVKITGDPDVVGAVAEGAHAARREGDTLVIDGHAPEGWDPDSWTFRRERPRIVIGLGSKPRPLAVRMNPDLPLEVRVDAGSANVDGVRGPIHGEVDAGALHIRGAREPFELSVDAGSVSVGALLDHGESRIRCDAGSVKVRLEKGSSVRVKADTHIGRISLGRGKRDFRIGAGAREQVFGAGDATLVIEGGIGRVAVEEA